MSESTMRDRWYVRASHIAKRTYNPIRSIVENIVVEPNPNKSMIALSIGDPTIFGNLRPPREAIEAVQESIASQLYNGYAPSTGYEKARQAVAEYNSSELVKVDSKGVTDDEFYYDVKQIITTASLILEKNSVAVFHLSASMTYLESQRDVILCSGCSCALDLCITALAREGQNILMPRPGFPIYRTLAQGLGIAVKSYNLRPELGWEIDLDDLESQIDESTAAIIINNPSNPCGSVFSSDHILDVLNIAARYYIPIIADEVYEHMVYPGRTFRSLASLSTEVPILACSGLTKRFLVPGWRMGWIIIHDRQNVLDEIRTALQCLSQRIIGSNTIVQGALPAILRKTPQKFYDDVVHTLYSHSKLTYNLIMKISGLKPLMPGGAMYMMVYIDLSCFPEFNSDIEFIQHLLIEESVFCLPGKCFDYPSYMRIVITLPEEMLEEACHRLQEFCERHHYETAEKVRRNSLVDAEIPY